MKRNIRAGIVAAALALSVISLTAQTNGVFFFEDWETGVLGGSFNSANYGNVARGSQYGLQNGVRALGNWALQHSFSAGLTPAQVQYVTQHFGDAPSGPVLSAGSSQHFNDFYLQYRVYYSPGFDFNTGYKQFIFGTQDDRRHEDPCCNPWVAHYTTIYLREGGTLLAEANNKRAASGQWVGLAPNTNGYSTSNRFRLQSAQWYTIEVRRRLNDMGLDNGIFQMWVNGQLVSDYRAVRYRIPWNGSYGANYAYGTNFAMISDYAYDPVTRSQSLYYDAIKFSTAYIGTGGVAGPSAPTNLRILR